MSGYDCRNKCVFSLWRNVEAEAGPIGSEVHCREEFGIDNDRQLELDALGRSKPVETGESICNML